MGSLGTEEVPVTGSTDSILIHTQPTSVFLPTHRFWKEQAGHERKGFTQSDLLIIIDEASRISLAPPKATSLTYEV
jgi:hypothetical protein